MAAPKPLPPLTDTFKIQLDRIISQLKSSKPHASGPRRPTLTEQEDAQ